MAPVLHVCGSQRWATLSGTTSPEFGRRSDVNAGRLCNFASMLPFAVTLRRWSEETDHERMFSSDLVMFGRSVTMDVRWVSPRSWRQPTATFLSYPACIHTWFRHIAQQASHLSIEVLHCCTFNMRICASSPMSPSGHARRSPSFLREGDDHWSSPLRENDRQGKVLFPAINVNVA